MPLKSCQSTSNKVHCALCGAKDVTEPKGEERYCADCWDKKIAVEFEKKVAKPKAPAKKKAEAAT